MSAGAWVAVEDELALGLVGTAGRRVRRTERLLGLARRSDPARLLAVLGRQRLIHLGIARLGELGAGGPFAEIERQLAPALRAARWNAVEQEMLTHSLVGALEEERVTAVPLKGAVLGRRLFGDPALRESDDVDLLVTAAQLESAVTVLRRRFGYDPPRDAHVARGRPLLHYRMTHPQGLPMVELHWRVHWYEQRSGAAMVARSIVEDGLRRLAPADELACLMLVYARDGFAGLRPLADLARWWDLYGARLATSGLAPFTREFPELGPALRVSAMLADTLAGVPQAQLAIPAWPDSARALRAKRLANWQLRGQDEQINADIAVVDLLLAPTRGAWSFVRRQVLLPLDVMATRLPAPRPARPRLMLEAALHAPRILARFALAWLATSGGRGRSALPPTRASLPPARDAVPVAGLGR